MEQRLKRALARLIEAYIDLRTAKLLSKKVESRSLFHSQQSVEKALKACLSIRYSGDIKVHEVMNIFREEILPHADESIEQGFSEILAKIKWIEKRWIDTRYEIEKGDEIKIPSMIFKTEDALEGLIIAERVIELSRKFLEGYFNIKIPKRPKKLMEMVK